MERVFAAFLLFYSNYPFIQVQPLKLNHLYRAVGYVKEVQFIIKFIPRARGFTFHDNIPPQISKHIFGGRRCVYIYILSVQQIHTYTRRQIELISLLRRMRGFINCALCGSFPNHLYYIYRRRPPLE